MKSCITVLVDVRIHKVSSIIGDSMHILSVYKSGGSCINKVEDRITGEWNDTLHHRKYCQSLNW